METQKPILRKALFWDIKPESIDFDKHVRYVVERVLTRGNCSDWSELRKFYGLERIKSEIIQVRYLDRITLSFCSAYFNIPKEKFRCYNTKQSTQQLWNN